MEPSGKSRLVVSALLLSLIEPWSCPAQAPAPPTSTSAATPVDCHRKPPRSAHAGNERADRHPATDRSRRLLSPAGRVGRDAFP